MSLDRLHVHGPLADYLDGLGETPDHIAARYEEHAGHPSAQMMTHPDLGRLLGALARQRPAGRAIEVGTFVGISAAWMLDGLGPDGRLDALELSDEYADLTEAWLGGLGLASGLTVHRGPAAETLARLDADTYDLCYIDADKPAYPLYLDEAARIVRPGGAIVADNVFSGGLVADPEATGNAAALREFTRYALSHPGVDTCVLPIGDGITLSIVRRPPLPAP